jgi:hypothetical protein
MTKSDFHKNAFSLSFLWLSKKISKHHSEDIKKNFPISELIPKHRKNKLLNDYISE